MTPTNASLGSLEPESLSRFSAEGVWQDGDKPTNEAFLHQWSSSRREMSGTVVHLHSTHTVTVSILDGIDAENVLPPLTAYYVMRVGTLPLIPYYPPSDQSLAEAVAKKAAGSHAILLANHGPPRRRKDASRCTICDGGTGGNGQAVSDAVRQIHSPADA
jgi:ribulose-5-phosphate 4-epimerase/fuculose-1-phosphate aldolase